MGAEFILLVNGPGELYTWAGPLSRALRRAAPNSRIVLGLLPCPFASGYERGIAETMPVDETVGVTESLEFIAGGRKPKGFQRLEHGLVIGLGGDVSFPGRIAARLGYPAWRYSFEGYWHKGLEKLLVHDARTLEKALKSGAKAENIGNLTADALELEGAPPKESGLDVLLIPGSRGFQVTHMLPFFAGVADGIATALPRARFHYPRSKLVTDEDFAVALSGVKVLDTGGVPLRLESSGLEGTQLITPAGTRIALHDENARYGLMKTADLAITVPGTNTLELGIALVPSIVCLPLQKMELIPIENPLRYLEVIPFVGKPLKRRLVETFLKRFEFFSLPNMIAHEAIQLELRGDLTVQGIAAQAIKLLEDDARRTAIKARLEATMPKPGTAARLAQMMLERVSDAQPVHA
jgi:Lipid-A-disaccharide synthetase